MKQQKQWETIFLSSKITAVGPCNHEIKRCSLLRRKAMTNLDSRDITLPIKVHLVKAVVFPVVTYGCERTILCINYKKSCVLKNWCFSIVVLEKILASPLDCTEFKPVNPKGNQSWIFNGGSDAEAETPMLWSPYVKNWLTGKDPDAGKDWRQEEKGTTEDEMVEWHHQLDGHEFEQALGAGDG